MLDQINQGDSQTKKFNKTHVSIFAAVGFLIVVSLLTLNGSEKASSPTGTDISQQSSDIPDNTILLPSDSDINETLIFCGDGICSESETYQTCQLDCPVFKRTQKPGEEITPADLLK